MVLQFCRRRGERGGHDASREEIEGLGSPKRGEVHAVLTSADDFPKHGVHLRRRIHVCTLTPNRIIRLRHLKRVPLTTLMFA